MTPEERMQQILGGQQATPAQAAPQAPGQMTPQAPGQMPPVPGQTPPVPDTWGEAFAQAGPNIGPSAYRLAEDLWSMVSSPIETAKGLGNLAMGVVQKAAPEGMLDEDKIEYADAVGEFFADRYGSMDAVKQTLAQDPVGLVADLSGLLSGGGTLAAKTAATAGRVAGRATSRLGGPGRIAARAAGTAADVVGGLGAGAARVGRLTDPLSVIGQAGRGAKWLGGRIAPPLFGQTSGVGEAAVRTAYAAGREGGEKGEALRAAMRGDEPIKRVLEEAKGALSRIREQRNRAYKTSQEALGRSEQILDFAPIDKALNKAREFAYSSAGRIKDKKAAAALEEISDLVDAWRKDPPEMAHTPLGMDELKQAIGVIGEDIAPGTRASAMVDGVYDAVWQGIADAAPMYKRMMKDYSEASELIREIEHELVGRGRKANIGTSLRKLQSIMRSNAQTNYGRRAELGAKLTEAGAETLVPRLAGQALAPWETRGIGRAGTLPALAGAGSGYGTGSLMTGAATAGGLLAAGSPRVAGEVAHALGRGRRAAGPVFNYGPMAARNIGRGGLLEERMQRQLDRMGR